MKQRIKLQTETSYYLPLEERKQLYTYLALAQYSYLRRPEYKTDKLLKQLSHDMKRFLIEAQALATERSNNHMLNKMVCFFDNHHRHLKEVVEGLSEDEV